MDKVEEAVKIEEMIQQSKLNAVKRISETNAAARIYLAKAGPVLTIRRLHTFDLYALVKSDKPGYNLSNLSDDSSIYLNHLLLVEDNLYLEDDTVAPTPEGKKFAEEAGMTTESQ